MSEHTGEHMAQEEKKAGKTSSRIFIIAWGVLFFLEGFQGMIDSNGVLGFAFGAVMMAVGAFLVVRSKAIVEERTAVTDECRKTLEDVIEVPEGRTRLVPDWERKHEIERRILLHSTMGRVTIVLAVILLVPAVLCISQMYLVDPEDELGVVLQVTCLIFALFFVAMDALIFISFRRQMKVGYQWRTDEELYVSESALTFICTDTWGWVNGGARPACYEVDLLNADVKWNKGRSEWIITGPGVTVEGGPVRTGTKKITLRIGDYFGDGFSEFMSTWMN